jgi:hypothetical protein
LDNKYWVPTEAFSKYVDDYGNTINVTGSITINEKTFPKVDLEEEQGYIVSSDDYYAYYIDCPIVVGYITGLGPDNDFN